MQNFKRGCVGLTVEGQTVSQGQSKQDEKMRLLCRFWFMHLREPLRRFKLALTARPGWLDEGRYRHLLGWERFVTEEKVDSLAHSLSSSDPFLPEPPQFHAFKPRRVYSLEGAVAWPGGAVLLNGHPVMEAGHGFPTKRIPKLLSVNLALKSQQTGIYSGSKTSNYYHWLIEDLPAILRARAVAPRFPVFLGGPISKYVSDSLALASISYEKITVPTRFLELRLAGRGDDSGWPHRDDLNLLRDTFLSSNKSNTAVGKKIFISRRNSRRGFVNESEIETYLLERGFETFVLEELTFQEQVRVFENAAFVVGAHGAGLSNLVFCPKGAKVLEISLPSHAVNCFRVLSKQLDLDHETLILSGHQLRGASTLSDSDLKRIKEHVDSMSDA